MPDSAVPAKTSCYVLADDMLFTSRITATGKSQALVVKVVRSVGGVRELLRQERPACIIIDLATPGLHVAEFLRDLSAGDSTRPFVVAYGSHIDAESLHAARTAGCDVVLPRSKFVENLPDCLSKWVAGATPSK